MLNPARKKSLLQRIDEDHPMSRTDSRSNSFAQLRQLQLRFSLSQLQDTQSLDVEATEFAAQLAEQRRRRDAWMATCSRTAL